MPGGITCQNRGKEVSENDACDPWVKRSKEIFRKKHRLGGTGGQERGEQCAHCAPVAPRSYRCNMATQPNDADKLRKSCPAWLSLAALAGDKALGRILFTPAKIEGIAKAVMGLGLEPVDVQRCIRSLHSTHIMYRSNKSILFRTISMISIGLLSNIYGGDRRIVVEVRPIPDLPGHVAESIVVCIIAAFVRLVVIAVMVSVYLRPSYHS